MKAYHVLAWKELSAQKLTTVLMVIAIVLSTIMTTVIGQSWGILQALREQQAGLLNGNRYATFHNLTKEQKAILEEAGTLSFVGSNIILGTAKLNNSGIALQLREYDKRSLEIYPTLSQISKGRLPQRPGEIALPQDALDYLGFSGQIGDTLTLDLSISILEDKEEAYAYKAEFTLCGILKSNYLAYVSGIVTGIAGRGTAEKYLPEKYMLYSTDFRTKEKKSFQQTVHKLADKVELPRSRIQYNWLYLKALGIKYDKQESDSDPGGGGISYMIAAGIIIGFLVLLAAGLVIYNVLKISVSKRIKAYGILRAIGGRQRQLYLLVAEQLILLCLVGIPAGAVLGVLSADGITKAATSLFSPEIFMVQNMAELQALIGGSSKGKLLPLLISTAITLISAFIAAMPVAHYAAKVSPTVAMNGITGKVKRRSRRERPIRHFEAFYARLNLRRNMGRTTITILSLVMSITVFVALQSFSGLLDISRDVQKLHLGGYSITNEAVGFEPAVVKELNLYEGVAYLHTLKYSLYMQQSNGTLPIETGFRLKPGETFQVVGVDLERFKILLPTLTSEELQEIKDGKACLVKNPVSISYEGRQSQTTSFDRGDTISVAKRELKVLGICNAVGLDNQGFVNGVQVVVFDTVYDELTGKNTYSELYPVLAAETDKQVLEQKIEQICNKTAGSRWLSYQNTDKQLEESYRQIKLLGWGLILFIGLIGLLNIINTTYTNLHTRVNEIGMQRAVGMSKTGLYKTFLWEGAYYGIIASAAGAIAGYICTIMAEAAVTDKIALTAFPVSSVLQVSAMSVAACLLATCLPLGGIAKRSIVEAIEIVE